MKKVLLVSCILLRAALPAQAKAFLVPKENLLNKNSIAVYTPHVINPKYFSFEFGFLSKKSISSINYAYRAFAEAFIAEESYTTDTNLRAAALGFKGGVILPTQPWIPLNIQFGFGYAKTALHESPWFGRRDESKTIKDMFLVEAGLLYQYKDYFLRLIYQQNNLKFFTKKSFFSMGANF